MKTKLFNPKRCPYKQLKEHTGEALVYVFKKHTGSINRMRLVSVPPQKDDLKDRSFSQYEMIERYLNDEFIRDEVRWGAYKSCFDEAVESAVRYEEFLRLRNRVKGRIVTKEKKVKKYTYNQVIDAMESYDIGYGLVIWHIEFN